LIVSSAPPAGLSLVVPGRGQNWHGAGLFAIEAACRFRVDFMKM
jgi:hypothetical protein